MKVSRLLVLVLVAVALGATSAWASVSYDVDKPLGEYGYINQIQVPNPAGWPWLTPFGQVACGPTSAVNSFIYLQNHYGLNLGVVAGNENSAVQTLGLMMGITSGGVSDAGFIAGKEAWLGQYGGVSMKYQSVAVGGIIPTWRFIYDELKACEDVEVGFNWGTEGGHWITATSFHFTDAGDDPNGQIDPGETATLDFIDPWTGVHLVGNLTMDPNRPGYLDLTYVGGGAGNGATGWIDIVVAESPIPEPATLVVWSLLATASWLGVRVWRQGRRVGRPGWPDENRAAIYDIIERGHSG
jgi:hypothetical protein